MNTMWLDIEEYTNNKFKVGFLIVDNIKKQISGYETLLTNKNQISLILQQYNISTLFVFNENDLNYIKGLEYLNNNFKIINILNNYQKLIGDSKIQISKNSDIARASGINVNYDRLHSPLYDIQLSYCTFHNFKISSIDQQMDMLYDSFFVLTGKLDFYWTLIKNSNLSLDLIDLKIVRTKQFKNRYFFDSSLIDKNIFSFLEYETNQRIDIPINSKNINQLINFFEENIILFLNGKDSKEISKKIWNIIYYSNIRYNNKHPLYIFFGINLSRFKNRILNFSIDTIKKELNNELSINNLIRINKEA